MFGVKKKIPNKNLSNLHATIFTLLHNVFVSEAQCGHQTQTAGKKNLD